jgi:hypothetical protein
MPDVCNGGLLRASPSARCARQYGRALAQRERDRRLPKAALTLKPDEAAKTEINTALKELGVTG